MPERSLVLVRQFRPPAGKFCLEFPAGLVEPGEDFLTALSAPEALLTEDLYFFFFFEFFDIFVILYITVMISYRTAAAPSAKQ